MEKEFTVSEDLFASHGQRFLNYIIDVIVIYILIFVLGFVAALLVAFSGGDTESIFGNISDFMGTIIFLVIMILYYMIFEGFFSRSIAKFITKTIVVNENGTKPDFLSILRRSLCRIIPFDALSFLGGSARGWHDSIPDIYVVKKDLFEEKKALFYSFEEIGEKQDELN